MDTFRTMDLKKLEETVYALQIEYNPPLQEKDRDYVISKIEKLREKYKSIASSPNNSFKRKSKKCSNSSLLSTGENEKEYKTHMLVFVPYIIEGVEVFRCFDRYELRKYMENKQDPYTGENFTPKQLKVIQKALDKKYPNIPVGTRMEEIQKRLFQNDIFLPSTHSSYLETAHFLKDRIEKETQYSPIYLENFCTELSPEQYQLFLKHKNLDFATIDVRSLSRDEAARVSLEQIKEYIFHSPKNEKNALLEMGNAIDEYYYMTYHNLTYLDLLEKKGKEIIGQIKELFWKPSFLVEMHHSSNENILAERYLTDEGKIVGSRVFYDINGNIIQEYVYDNGKIAYINNYSNGKLQNIIPFEHSAVHGNVIFYYPDGLTQYAMIGFEHGIRKGLTIFFYENGKVKEKLMYTYSEKEYSSHPEGEVIQNYESSRLKKKMMYENGIIQSEMEYYNNPEESMKEKKMYANGLMDGLVESFYSNGAKDTNIHFAKGKMNGKWESYYDDGNKKEECYYENDRIEGKRTIYHRNGNIEMVCFYENGKETGRKREYYSDGTAKSDVHYKFGEKNGAYQYFYDNGKIREKGSYLNGEKNGIYTLFFENGLPKKTVTYVNGKREGEFVLYFDNGKIRKKAFYRNGLRNGWTVTYYANEENSIKKECYCVNGQKGGIHKTYFSNGVEESSYIYENGRLTSGNYFLHYENGNLKEVGMLLDGKKYGEVIEYTEEGKKKSECEYINDQLNGECRFYYPETNTLRRRYLVGWNGMEGYDVLYYENGQIAERWRYDFGQLSGPYEKYYENGQAKEVGRVEKGEAPVKIKSWDEDGNLVFETEEKKLEDTAYFSPPEEEFSLEETLPSEEDSFSDEDRALFEEDESSYSSNISDEEEGESSYPNEEEYNSPSDDSSKIIGIEVEKPSLSSNPQNYYREEEENISAIPDDDSEELISENYFSEEE